MYTNSCWTYQLVRPVRISVKYENGMIRGSRLQLAHVAGKRAIELDCYRHGGGLQLPASKVRSILGFSPNRSPLVIEKAEVLEKVVVVCQRMGHWEIKVSLSPSPPFRLDIDVVFSNEKIARVSLLARSVQ